MIQTLTIEQTRKYLKEQFSSNEYYPIIIKALRGANDETFIEKLRAIQYTGDTALMKIIDHLLDEIQLKPLHKILHPGGKIYWQAITSGFYERHGRIFATQLDFAYDEEGRVLNTNSELVDITRLVSRALGFCMKLLKGEHTISQWVCIWDTNHGASGHTKRLSELLYADPDALKSVEI